MWLVAVVSRMWVWLVGGIYGYGYNLEVWLVRVVVRRYIFIRCILVDILTIIINLPYSTCISSFLAAASLPLKPADYANVIVAYAVLQNCFYYYYE